METTETAATYPTQLLRWAGNRSGGVRRLFDDKSGRPSAAVFKTNLLSRLQQWCADIGAGKEGTPRVILLVGGPGNGKTEAIEATMNWLDSALGCDGKLSSALEVAFRPEGEKVPRTITIEAGALATPIRSLPLSIVQDASVIAGSSDQSPAMMLLSELASATASDSRKLYLCCVNRGVLDDALIAATEAHADEARRLLECTSQAVSLSPDAPACWPLDDYPDVAVWPMDMESLLAGTENGDPAPAVEIFRKALDASLWPQQGTCAAGAQCPFCGSRSHLAREQPAAALQQMLRWFEIGSGKRWSFRDLFSLVSYLLAGHREDASLDDSSPCEWAASLLRLDQEAVANARPRKDSSTAIFRLVGSQYQHALFHGWDKEAGQALLRDLTELGLKDNNTAMGLQWFLASRRASYLPTMISGLLDGFDQLLDPALASPESEAAATHGTTYVLRDFDTRFSRSVAEGLDHVKKSRVLSGIEIDLLGRLAELDSFLSKQQVRRKKPAVATRVQRLVRDFACRLVRRSIGARTATVLDAEVLREFQKIVDVGGDGVFEVARDVERLLNKNQDFEVSLTTTFGQPLPPPTRRATLVVQRRHVQPTDAVQEGRPRSPLRFLEVGDGASAQKIALTYDLFKAVKEVDRGMSVASLPRSVLALLDTTGARLGGPIVRDAVVLPRAEIRLGTGGVAVQQRREGFGLLRETGRR
ncbi:conserved hypothetical protein [Mesorhizobium sp. SOD10]|nr:conserved hypothetical protein [Mesorhizobium sp. SOD10]